MTIGRPDPSSGIRRLRAVFDDLKIAQHPDPRVRQLSGQEPWIPYAATVTDDEILEAGEAMVSDLAKGAKTLIGKLKTATSTLTGT